MCIELYHGEIQNRALLYSGVLQVLFFILNISNILHNNIIVRCEKTMEAAYQTVPTKAKKAK